MMTYKQTLRTLTAVSASIILYTAPAIAQNSNQVSSIQSPNTQNSTVNEKIPPTCLNIQSTILLDYCKREQEAQEKIKEVPAGAILLFLKHSYHKEPNNNILPTATSFITPINMLSSMAFNPNINNQDKTEKIRTSSLQLLESLHSQYETLSQNEKQLLISHLNSQSDKDKKYAQYRLNALQQLDSEIPLLEKRLANSENYQKTLRAFSALHKQYTDNTYTISKEDAEYIKEFTPTANKK